MFINSNNRENKKKDEERIKSIKFIKMQSNIRYPA